MSAESGSHPTRALKVAGLFAGIGGIELGLRDAGHETELLCEIDPAAQAVLRDRFPTVPLTGDVRELESLDGFDLVAAGFPCQDLSQAGRTVGITGLRSALVGKVFDLLENSDPDWLLLENVSFMLQLGRGAAMSYLTGELMRLGFRWAYRVLDTMASPNDDRESSWWRLGDGIRVQFSSVKMLASSKSAIIWDSPTASTGQRGYVGWGGPSTPFLR